jgi:outer membrane receptor protein involved in Fe transport
MGRTRFARVLLCAVVLVFSAIGWAQVTTATLGGTVTDPTGAITPGARVVVTQQETGAASTKVTGTDGEFQFDFLRVGTYTITIEAQGFKRYEVKGIGLTAGQNVRSAHALQVGDVAETVQVEGTAPQVNTVSSEQTQTFESKTVVDLPLARRNFSGILRVGAGVTPASGGSANGVRLNGVGRNGTAFSVDGTESSGNPEGRNAGNFAGVNYVDTLSMESIEEVNVVKGILPAEYGGALGGQIDVVTRSGTNQFHGSLFENFQKESLNARDPFLTAKAPFTYNQFGGSFGGPIKKNKIFLFGAFEGYRETQQARVEITVPTQTTRDSVLKAVPAYANTLAVVPLPNQPFAAGAATGLFNDVFPAERRDNHIDLKSDIRTTDNSNLSLTYSHGRPYRLVPAAYIDGQQNAYIFTERATASYVTGGATWTSETRYGYNQNDADTSYPNRPAILDAAHPKEEFVFGRRLGRLITNQGWNTIPGNSILIIEGPTMSLGEKFSKHLGKHSLKFGGLYTHHSGDRNNVEGVAWTYTGSSDLLNNIPSAVNASFGNGENVAHMWEMGLFIQDDWRVTSKLTLNLGLRYDYNAHLTAEALNNSGSALFNPDGLLDVNTFKVGPFRPQNNPYESDPVNFGPRFGFAYNVDNGKTVIRGGTGIIYSPQIIGNMWNLVGTEFEPKRIIFSRQEAITLGLKYPMYNDDLRKAVEAQAHALGFTNIFAMIDPHIKSPYTHHYTLGIQRELAKNLVLETSMVGVRGTRFPLWRPMNEPNRATGIRPNPLLRATYYMDGSATSQYASWQTSLRKRYSRSFSASAHYTWGKTLAYNGGDIGTWFQGDNTPRVQDFNNVRAEHAPATGDITHYFSSQAVYDLPALSTAGNAIVRRVLGGWQAGSIFEARSGEPLEITQSSSLQVARPDYVGGDPINDNPGPARQYLNKSAFALVPVVSASGATSRPGNLGWGAVRAPGYWNVDFSVTKVIPIKERMRAIVRAEMFNAFNHFNPLASAITTSLNSSTFGQIRGGVSPRVIQLNGRLTW